MCIHEYALVRICIIENTHYYVPDSSGSLRTETEKNSAPQEYYPSLNRYVTSKISIAIATHGASLVISLLFKFVMIL